MFSQQFIPNEDVSNSTKDVLRDEFPCVEPSSDLEILLLRELYHTTKLLRCTPVDLEPMNVVNIHALWSEKRLRLAKNNCDISHTSLTTIKCMGAF